MSADQMEERLKNLTGHLDADLPQINRERLIAKEFYDVGRATTAHPQLVSHLMKMTKQYRDDANKLLTENQTLSLTIASHKRFQASNVWYWQGDGEDHLESLTNDMAVVIDPKALLKLINRNTALVEAARDVLTAYYAEFGSHSPELGDGPINTAILDLGAQVNAIDKDSK